MASHIMKNYKKIGSAHEPAGTILYHSSQLKTEANLQNGFRPNQVKD